MTRLHRPVMRLTNVEINDGGHTRPVVAILASDGIYLRQQRRRTAYHLPYQAAYSVAVKLAVMEARREAKRKKDA